MDYKNYMIQSLNGRINSLSKDIAGCENVFANDFFHYMTTRLKSHVIAVVQRQWLEQLFEWIKEEDSEYKIREWLQNGVDSMTEKLLNFKVIQSTNELSNLKENYQLEAYCELIRLYKIWLAHK